MEAQLQLDVKLLKAKVSELNELRRSTTGRSQHDEIKQLMEYINLLKENTSAAKECLLLCTSCAVNFEQKLVYETRIPSNLPTFKVSKVSENQSDIFNFLESFEVLLQCHNIDPARWSTIFLQTIPMEESGTLRFAKENVLGKPWEKARESLIAHFDTPDIARSFNQKLLNARREIGENISHFSDRFYLYVERSKMDPNSTFICDKYMACLPERLQNQLTELCLSKPKLTDLIKKCIEIDSFNNSLLQLSTLNLQQSKQTTFKKICTYCTKVGHMEYECLKKKNELMEIQKNVPLATYQTRNVSAFNNTNELKRNSPLSTNSFKPRLPNASNSTLNRKPFFGPKSAACTSADISEYSLSSNAKDSTDYCHTAAVCHSQIQNLPNLIYVPVRIGKMQIEGLLDTGSQVSMIDKTLADELELNIQPSKLLLRQVDGNAIVNTYGQVNNVEITINDNTISQNFIVVDKPASGVCLLGIDFFRNFNLYIGGFSINPSQNTTSQIVEEETVQNIPSCHQKFIITKLTNLFKENQKTINQFCNQQNAIVRLPTGNESPFWVNQYPIAGHLIPIVDEQVNKWIDNKVIVPSKQGWQLNSPLLVVKKANSIDGNSQYRVCLDPRKLNLKLEDDKHPIPHLRSLLDEVSGCSLFSSLDLYQSYHQFLISEEDQIKTSFSWKNKQYRFQGAPFGLKILTSIFQRVMTQLFADMNFVAVFIDDILVFSNDLDSHILHLQQVIIRLTSACLTLNIQKCKFGFTKLKVLGHCISANGIEVDKTKLNDIFNLARPKSAKDVQSFLGVANYFREFIPYFAFISKPLDILRNCSNVEDEWNENHELAFNALKQALTTPPIISFANNNRDVLFYRFIDSSIFTDFYRF